MITDASLQAQAKEHLRFFERIRERGQAPVHISVAPTNPHSKAAAVVIWRNATVRVGRDGPGRPLREFLNDETVAKLRFGQSPDGSAVGPNDFWTASGESFSFNLAVPEDARFAGLEVDVELVPEQGSDAVLRLLVSESEEESGRPAWALLADSNSRGFREWKADVLEYAASFPQTSHGEPTPSDRDPIPPPFDNTYNQPERDRFHFRVKYYRDDRFLVEKMLDDATRRRLDDAWSDLMASFEYHDAFLDFVEDKFGLDLDGKAIGELTAADIARLPAEPRKYVEALHNEYTAVQAAQKAAQPGHVEDAIRFASRAWRRLLSADEEEALRSFYQEAKTSLGLDHEQAIRALLTRILVAPPFLYRLEEPTEVASVAPLSDWELASRLSYFLWSSTPDQTLREVARAGKLSDSAELERQVERMLAAPKARRLATEFFGQWLGFYRFDRYRGVDAKRFPEFTDEVKAAMYNEAVSFFEHVIRKDRPIREIFSADYTFLNQALAKHYGVEKEITSTDGVELVSGANAFERGGLLRLGAILTATSAPLRTSPVKRGDWMLRRILGTPTPPPPPDAGSIPADDQLFGGLTVRERLEAHKRNPTCASCHSRIDPLGFPFEHFDPVGRWREAYPDGKPIDASAALADTEIDGVEGLLGYLDREQEQVLRNLSHKLLGYALGRTVLASDQPLVERLAQAGGDATFRELATQIVLSPQFRYRRGLDDSQYSKDATPATAAAVGGSGE